MLLEQPIEPLIERKENVKSQTQKKNEFANLLCIPLIFKFCSEKKELGADVAKTLDGIMLGCSVGVALGS
jgi:hypothetical protein